jgi:hypothetical protein
MRPSFPTPPPPSLALRVAVARMSPVATRRPWRQAATVIVASLAATGAWIAFAGVCATWLAIVAPAVTLVALFVARVLAASVPTKRAVLPGPQAPLAKTALIGAGAVASMLLAHGAPSLGLAAAFGHATWTCLWRGTVAWAVPTVIAAVVLQRVVGSWRIWREIAGASAALAALTLLVVCDSRDVAHIVVAHGSVVMLLPAIGIVAAVSGARRLIGR